MSVGSDYINQIPMATESGSGLMDRPLITDSPEKRQPNLNGLGTLANQITWVAMKIVSRCMTMVVGMMINVPIGNILFVVYIFRIQCLVSRQNLITFPHRVLCYVLRDTNQCTN